MTTSADGSSTPPSPPGFPCGWFYFIAAYHGDVVRLLAAAQDLPAILAATEHE